MKIKNLSVKLTASNLGRLLLAVTLFWVGLGSLPTASAASVNKDTSVNTTTGDTTSLTTYQSPLNIAASRLRPTDVNQNLHLAIALYSQDETGLEKFLANLNDVNSSSYHQYLTPAQFDARFGPAKSTRTQLVNFLQSKGLRVNDSGTGVLIDADGTVGQVQAAFNVAISDYRDITGRVFFSNDRTPALPLNLSAQIRGVNGLSNQLKLHSRAVKANNSASVSPQSGTPNPADCSPAKSLVSTYGAFVPDQLATAYDMNSFYSAGYKGEGQTIAFYELADYDSVNITTFQSCFPYLSSSVNISRVTVDGGPSANDNAVGQGEVELDMEIALGLVPNLGKMLVYEAPNNGDANYLDLFQKIYTDNLAQVLSDSWGDCEPDYSTDTSFINSENGILQQFAATGISVFAASGDSGRLDCTTPGLTSTIAVDDPASQPYVTGVGGTTLSVNSDNTYSSETVWSNFSGAGGGGVSVIWAKPGFQTGTGVNNANSTGKREVPDVSGSADPNAGYAVYSQSSWTVYGGTSAAAPLWAAQTILTNQYLAANSKPRVGFANPVLYQVFNTPGLVYPAFHDVTTGANAYNGDPGYPATSGYDLASGIGTFDGWNIARDLKNLGAPTPTLYVVPGQLTFSGTAGSSQPISQSLNVSISGNGTLNWTATPTTNAGGNWLSVAPTSGTVSSAGPISQTVYVNTDTTGLSAGTYTGNILFSSTGFTQTTSVAVTLTVNPGTTPPPSTYTYYLPFLANQANQFSTYLAIQNTGTGTANVQVQYYNNSGTSNGSDSCTNLAANAECLPSVLSKFQVGQTGAGIITSTQPLNVIVAESTPFGGSAYAVGSGSSNNLIAPLAIKNAGGFATRLSVFNGGSTPVSATVRFFSKDGVETIQAARTLTIQPRTSNQLDQTDPTNGLPDQFYGWAQITSASGSNLVAQVLEQNPSNHFVAIANAQSNAQSTLYAPAIFNGAFGGFVTGSNIVNPNSTPVTVTITYHDANGAVPTLSGNQPTSRVLPPYSVLLLYDGGGNTGLANQFYGSATVNSSGGGVVMVVNELGPSLSATSSQSGTYPAIGSGSNTVSLPVIANGGFGYKTGLTILNTSAQALTGKITYYNIDGSLQGVTQTFSIGAFASQPIYQGAIAALTGTNGFYGTAVITVTGGGSSNSLIVTTNALSSQFFYTYTEPTQ